MPKGYLLFTEEQKTKITNSIEQAEKKTSGEIRVHLEEDLKINVLDRAADIFVKLNMHKTVERNGVLIYLAVKEKQFAIIGDQGIHEKVPANFWDEIKNKMQEEFANERFTEGILIAVEKSGQQLKQYFPVSEKDINELSDEISY